jgi:putative MATE family efflux protein
MASLLLRSPAPGFYRNLFALVAPLVLQNLLTQSLALIDTLMVGSLGEKELAALTYANTPFFVIMLLLFGLQSGSSVLISQYWGQRDLTNINRVLGVAVYIAGGLSLVACGGIFFFTDAVMSLVTSNQELLPLCNVYGRIVAFSYCIDSVALMYFAAQRSIGNSRLGMMILGASMLINTFLNWVLIFGHLGAPALGIKGAAIATLLARCVELIITVICALRLTNLPLQLKVLLRPGLEMWTRFFRYAAPVVANELLWGLAFSIYPIIIGHMRDSVSSMAAYTIVGNLERVISSFHFGFGAGTAIVIGNMIGAGDNGDQVYFTGVVLNRLAVIVGALAGGTLLLLTVLLIRPWLFPLLQLGPVARGYADIMLLVLAFLTPLRAFGLANIVGVLRGGGDVKVALFIDLLPMYCLSLPAAAYLCLVLEKSVLWIYGAMVLEESVRAVVSFFRFRSRKWIRDVTRN